MLTVKNRLDSLTPGFLRVNVFINDIWNKVRSRGDWDQSLVVVSSFLEFKKLKEIF